jgi:hypothetical protein
MHDAGEIEVRVEASRVRVLGSSSEAAASQPSTTVVEPRESDPVADSAQVSAKEDAADALPAAVSEEKETERPLKRPPLLKCQRWPKNQQLFRRRPLYSLPR